MQESIKGVCKYCLGCEQLVYIPGKEECPNFEQYDKQGYVRHIVSEQMKVEDFR